MGLLDNSWCIQAGDQVLLFSTDGDNEGLVMCGQVVVDRLLCWLPDKEKKLLVSESIVIETFLCMERRRQCRFLPLKSIFPTDSGSLCNG